jgi:hypothetical protein
MRIACRPPKSKPLFARFTRPQPVPLLPQVTWSFFGFFKYNITPEPWGLSTVRQSRDTPHFQPFGHAATSPFGTPLNPPKRAACTHVLGLQVTFEPSSYNVPAPEHCLKVPPILAARPHIALVCAAGSRSPRRA